MKYDYKISKGLGKAVMFMLQLAASALVVLGLADVSVWDLVVEYVKPIVGTMTLGGALVVATNFVKYNWIDQD